MMRRILIGCMLVMSCTLLQAQQKRGVTILYDNDVHCYVSGYPAVAGLADSLRQAGHEVLIVSNGDFTSGNTLGNTSRGEYIVRLMNVAGYDYATLGNHEFDYGMAQLTHLVGHMGARIVCCNFVDSAGHPVMSGGILRQVGECTLGIVGVATPESLTSSAPTYFQDKHQRYLYDFCTENLIPMVQQTVDSLRRIGAETIVVLSHLGDQESNLNSRWLIAHTHGIDVVLDGHDHHVIPQEWLPNREGAPVLLSSTGEHFDHIGQLTITPFAGRSPMVSTQLHSTRALRAIGCERRAVADTLEAIERQHNAKHQGLHYTNQVALTAVDAAGMRVTRMKESNLGDFVSDAYRIVSGAQIGWMNGGGLRTNLPAGKITYNELSNLFPYENPIVVVRVKGSDILEALEMSVRKLPSGAFAQVSGLSYEIDTTVASTVEIDEHGIFQRMGERRRVKNVRLVTDRGSEPLEPGQYYTIAASDFVILKHGDGVNFKHVEIVQETIGSDLEIVRHYIDMLGGVIGHAYLNPQKRINFK